MGHSRFSKARKKKWAGINCKWFIRVVCIQIVTETWQYLAS
jgi:hypothetical protein